MVKEPAFEFVPVPFDVHATLLWLVALDSAAALDVYKRKQVDTAVPATAVGAAVMVSVLVEVAGEQVPLPLAVKVNVTLPDSPEAGV